MLSFATPLWLICTPLIAGLLLYAYLRHGRSKQSTISSLFLIKKVAPSSADGRRKLALPWRLILEIFALFFLILALSGLMLERSGGRAMLLIDNSLSMGAHLDPGESRQTMLDEAKRSAISNLNLFSNIKQVSIWVSSPQPRQISAGFIPVSQATSLISEISAQFASANLSTFFSRLDQSAEKVFVFSDQLSLPQQQQQSQSTNPRFSVVPINTVSPGRQNIALKSIEIDRSLSRTEIKVIVKAQSYLNQQGVCRINLSEFKNKTWSILDSKDINFSGNAEKEIIFNSAYNGRNQDLALIFRAQISSCSSEKLNALLLDDTVWTSSRKDSSAITLVSDFSAQQLGLGNIRALEFDSIKPSEWAQKSSALGKNSSVIFHRVVPATLPESNALFIVPPEQSSIFKVSALGDKARLIRFDDKTGLLRYLSVPDLELKNAVKFDEVPAWAEALMYSGKGPVAIYGALRQTRYVALGFEIFPFEGKANPFMSILTLDLIKWLSDKSSGTQQNYNSLSIHPPGGQIISAAMIDSISPAASVTVSPDRKTINTDAPGLIEARFENSSEALAVNFFADNESNLGDPGFITIPETSTEQSSAEARGAVVLEHWLMLASLILLLIDCAYLIFRANQKSGNSGGQNAL